MTERTHKSKLRTLYYIEREKSMNEREEMKDKIATDIKDVMNRVTGKDNRPRKKRKIIKMALWIVGILFLLLILVNFILLNIWAFKFFIKSLFFNV